jgi:hypothetical protein
MINKISVQIEGKNYDTIIDASIKRDIENLCNTFNITFSTSDDIGNFPVDIINPSNKVVIAIDDEPLITGYVDSIDIRYSYNSHIITIAGRDRTADLVDSLVDVKQYNSTVTLPDLIKQVCQSLGFEVSNNPLLRSSASNSISIINNFGVIEPFNNSDILRAQLGQSAFEVIHRYAAKRNVLINTDPDGNIVLVKIGGEVTTTILQNVRSGNENNIKNASVSYNYANRFNQYTVKSRVSQGGGMQFAAGQGGEKGDPLPKATASVQVGTSFDNQIRSTRKFIYVNSSSMNSGFCKKRADWENNVRLKKSRIYSCDIFGFRQNNNEILSLNPLWSPNQITYVNDEFAGINEEMLIKSVEYRQDSSSGSITKLELVDEKAYTESLNEPVIKQNLKRQLTNKNGQLFNTGQGGLEA